VRRGTGLQGIIFPFFLPIVILTVTLLSFSLVGRVQPAVYDHTTSILRENAYFLRDLTAPLLADDETRFRLKAFRRIEHSSSRIALYDAQGLVIASSGVLSGESPAFDGAEIELTERALQGHEVQRIISPGGSGDRQRMYIAVPVYAPAGERLVGVVEVSTSLQRIQRGVESIYRFIFYLALGMLIIAYLSSWYIARRLAKPLQAFTRAARGYGELNFRYRPYIDGPAEMQAAAEALGDSVEAVNVHVRQLLHDKEELQTIFQGMVEGVIVLDGNLTIKELNPAVANLLNLDIESVRGKNLIHAVRHSELYELAEQAARDEQLAERTVQLPLSRERSSSGPRLPTSARIQGYLYLRIHASCITTDIMEHGIRRTQKRIILVMNDITRLKNLERMRKDFVSNVSHELKTPITSIKGFTETLREGAAGDPETAGRFIDIIHHHTVRLESIIEDLLSLSRLERENGSGVEKEAISAAPVIEGAVNGRSAKAQEKGIELTFDCGEDIELQANASLLEQALLNLVDNAVKYCPAGSAVSVSCGRTDGWVSFRVEDNGPGIPSKELDRIFERFYRVDKTRSRQLGGTGLGLAIVKHIAIAHGGTIDVESTEGAGTSFILTVPREQGPV
jgi:two-component system phosphate regulon sensor histidine kinase PhoR